VVEHLGPVDAPGVDVLVVLRHHKIPDELPPEVEEAAAALPEDPRPEDWEGRTDLRDVPTVTIDGATARDFDDAITCERLGHDRWRLGVHIADVAHYVTEGSALDREAYRRGTSVYYPDRAVPMLPERLSNGLCSLRPEVPRLAMSAFLDVGGDGQVQRSHFTQSVIQSDRRMTYDEVRRLLEEPAAGDRAEYGPILDLLAECRELMTVRNDERRRRGSIDFDLPEGDVVLDTDGQTVGVTRAQRHVAHRIVEEFMIAANEAVAATLDEVASPALYRVHDAPSSEDLEGLAQVLGSLGIRLPADLDRLHPRHLQQVLEEVAGKPQEDFVTTLVLRTMQRAVYSPECRGHYALASRYYTHFTSPIRRYPDLVVHRRMKAFIAHRDEVEEGPLSLVRRLPGIAAHASTTERRAEQSERDLLQWKKVRFLAGRVGETFSGRVTGVQPFGLFVVLDEYHVDGLVPIRSMSDDYYVFEPDAHRWVGSNHGRVFRLADPVEVRLAGVSLAHRGLDLEIADLAEPRRRHRGRRR
jgi:ribonuclease R